jgi:CRP-like cAMP-binding protein
VSDADVLTRLRNVGILRNFSDRDLARVADMAKEIDFGPGVPITQEGEPGGRFYILLEGDADVIVDGTTMRTLAAGDSFGEISLIDGQPRTATVVARTQVRTLSLASWNFRPMLLEYPTMAEAVMLEMCDRLRQLDASHLQ